MKLHVLIFTGVLSLVGCEPKPNPPPPPPEAPDLGKGADTIVDEWLAQHLRAERTMTHATGEHPAAEAEMRRLETQLRTLCKSEPGKTEVKKAIDARRAELDRKRKIAPPVEMRELDSQYYALDELAKDLGM